MNNAKMWLVVPPAVGVPVFLSAVAIGSFAVHVAVLTNTSWVDDFLQGKPIGSGDEMAATQAVDGNTGVMPASHVQEMDSGLQHITVILPDGTVARAVMEPPGLVGTAASPPLL